MCAGYVIYTERIRDQRERERGREMSVIIGKDRQLWEHRGRGT